MSPLIERIIIGDKEAVLSFYKTFSPRILKYLENKLPTKNDAEEILNDVFLDAIDYLPTLKKKENLTAWLYQISRNKVVDFYRKKKIKSVLLSQIPFLDFVANEINQPEFQFEKDKIRNKLEKTLSSLSARYCKILKLHYIDQIPVKNLTTIFNLSFPATQSLLFRARQDFKQKYERT